MTPIDTCVVLARGLGTRMRADEGAARLDPAQQAAADAGVKAMIPVGRPFLDYVLSGLADAGFRSACLVVGPEHTGVRDYYERTCRPSRIEVSFAIQVKAAGTADAVLAAEPFVARDGFVSVNGDNYYPVEVLRTLRNLGEPGTMLFDADALVRNSNIPADRIRDFADASVDANGFLADLIEKPRAAAPPVAGRLVSMNCWTFDARIFRLCRDVAPSPRGELELPLAVKLAVERGMRFRALVSREGVLDLSRRSDIAAVAERLAGTEVNL